MFIRKYMGIRLTVIHLALGFNMGVSNNKSRIISLRLDNEVFSKLKRLHPNYAEYLRERITYDLTRKHIRKRGNDEHKATTRISN